MSDTIKRRSIFDYYRKRSDIIVIQETHSKKENESEWMNEWGNTILFDHGESNARGVCVLIKKGFAGEIKNVKISNQGRYIIFDIIIEEVDYTCTALYAPNKDSPLFFKEIDDALVERSKNKIIIGDFNVVLNENLDRGGSSYNNKKSKEVLNNIMEHYELCDVWRIRNPDTKEFSWYRYYGNNNNKFSASRIDYALVSKGVDQMVRNEMYLPGIQTDHRAFLITVFNKKNQRGVGYWKINNEILNKEEYQKLIRNEISRVCLVKRGKSAIEMWELLKIRIKTVTQSYCRSRAGTNILIIAQLSEVVNKLESEQPLNEADTKLLFDSKKDLEEKIYERTKSFIFRSKARWYCEGERSTKYFYALQNAKYNAKTSFAILDQDQKLIDDNTQILEYQRQFYQNLYSKDEFVKFDLENKSGIQVSENQMLTQDCEFTLTEIKDAVNQMAKSKTPGKDGLSAEFYQTFFNELQELFMSMINETYTNGKLGGTLREGILNLIPKPNKDPREIKNLRPITLLNTDYKIIEKIIANRITPSLHEIINSDQRGFMQNRRISVNIRKLLDVMEFAILNDVEALIVSLDFQKCFDRVSFLILNGALDYFKFADRIKRWTCILYNDFQVRIQNNGNFSEKIEIQKGIHQGGCCSSLYFLIVAEILAIEIRSNPEIKGITINEIKNILNQFADDLDIFGNTKSVPAIFEMLETFKWQSGFQISYDKTTIYRIGSLKNSTAVEYTKNQVAWTSDDIKVLGIIISHEKIEEKNYEPLLTKTRSIVQSWEHRNLSLLGKINVVNTLISSIFVYRMAVLRRMSDSMFNKLDAEITKFLWSNKRAKIALKILQAPKKYGGQKLINFRIKDKSLKATWPFILQAEPEYSIMVYNNIDSTLCENIWRCNLLKDDVKHLHISNPFWQEILEAWCEFNFDNKHRVENQILWWNSRIHINNKPIRWDKAYKKGLLYVHQLYNADGMLKSALEINRAFDLNFMEYNSIVTAIPKNWRLFFAENSPRTFLPCPPHTYDHMTNSLRQSAKIYDYLLENESSFVCIKKQEAWESDLGIVFSLDNFHRANKNIFRVTNVVRFRTFQYRLLQRSLVVNKQLCKWGILDNDMCTFCKNDVETVLHIFCKRPVTKELRCEVWKFVRKRYVNAVINLQDVNVIMNTVHPKPNHVINYMCLVTKQYIYAQKCKGKTLHIEELTSRINLYEKIEKYNAVKNGNLTKHVKKWSN